MHAMCWASTTCVMGTQPLASCTNHVPSVMRVCQAWDLYAGYPELHEMHLAQTLNFLCSTQIHQLPVADLCFA